MMAQAVTTALGDAGWQAGTRDSMELLGGRSSRLAERVTQRLMASRGVYDALHFAHLRTGSPLANTLDRLATDRLLPALRAELAREPVDLIVSVFATGASTAARLRTAERPRTVVLCTDVAVHSLWVRDGTDLFLVTSAAAAESVRRYLPRAHVRVVPPPVRTAFAHAPTQAAARDELGLAQDEPCVLLLDSGWGFAPALEAARRLAGSGVQVLAVAGRHAGRYAQLRSLARETPRVRAFGFTDQVPSLMAASDLVLTLPGAMTCGEARTVGRPLMLLDLMPGHGRDNLQHELAIGSAHVCEATALGMTAGVLAVLERGEPLPAARTGPGWTAAFAAALGSIGLAGPSPGADTVSEADQQRRPA